MTVTYRLSPPTPEVYRSESAAIAEAERMRAEGVEAVVLRIKRDGTYSSRQAIWPTVGNEYDEHTDRY